MTNRKKKKKEKKAELIAKESAQSRNIEPKEIAEVCYDDFTERIFRGKLCWKLPGTNELIYTLTNVKEIMFTKG